MTITTNTTNNSSSSYYQSLLNSVNGTSTS
jgi:hypothetical protein